MLLGYARVSTTEQETAAQEVALKTAADAAQLFKVHPATVSRLLAGASLANPSEASVTLRFEEDGVRQIAPNNLRQIIQKVTPNFSCFSCSLLSAA